MNDLLSNNFLSESAHACCNLQHCIVLPPHSPLSVASKKKKKSRAVKTFFEAQLTSWRHGQLKASQRPRPTKTQEGSSSESVGGGADFRPCKTGRGSRYQSSAQKLLRTATIRTNSLRTLCLSLQNPDRYSSTSYQPWPQGT